MISGWVMALVILFLILLGGIFVLLMRIMTQNEIIIRAIPLGAPKVMERPRPAPQTEEQRTRPVSSTAQHRGSS